ncbi:PP2C family protein-serine/threonine phosphatase [Curtobacterium herbarum]|uniref:GAF domain-containing protein n=1 Tax=Curtobacterium herbarum TaxID=150122 RepID=A0ABN1ZCM3_9MICO|nr:GAF domain-containing protein [Curtobacterium herbarum]MBM7473903.1 GAF domain-containing protein [Curtobacterium herbarum]MCS6544769.1 GAF domain-containing protein [Curtobacterium herbarum]
MTAPQDADHRTALVEALDVLGAGPEERFDRITRMTHDAFGVPLTFLNLVHHDLVTTQSTYGWNQGTSVPASEEFCATTVLTPEPMVIPDTTLDPRFAHTPAVTEHGIRFYAGAPLSMLDGTRVGTLCIMDAQPRAFSASDLALLRDLARWAERELGYAIERDRLAKVREALVPDPLAVPGHDVATLTVQRPDGGGGLTDWRVAPDGALHVTVGAVVAGRVSALLAADVRGALAARTRLPITEAIAGLEAQVAPDLRVADAVAELVHARLDPTTGHVDLVDAGLGTAVVVAADGTVRPVQSTELPVGLGTASTPNARSTLSVDLAAGDRLVLASDAWATVPGVEGPEAIAALVAAQPDGAAAVEHVRALLPEGDPTTDLTLVVVTRR